MMDDDLPLPGRRLSIRCRREQQGVFALGQVGRRPQVDGGGKRVGANEQLPVEQTLRPILL